MRYFHLIKNIKNKFLFILYIIGNSFSKPYDNDTINWNNINTNDISSTLPTFKGIPQEVNELVSKIHKEDTSADSSEVNLNKILNNNDSMFIGGSKTIINYESENDSSSSPFITSEMYNYLVQKYKQTKEERKENEMIGGGEDTSDTSSDSDEEELEELESSSEELEDKNKTKKNKKMMKRVEDTDTGKDEMDIEADDIEDKYNGVSTSRSYNGYKNSENYLSYVSSSAHTNSLSENNYSISSINTSDINMISDN